MHGSLGMSAYNDEFNFWFETMFEVPPMINQKFETAILLLISVIVSNAAGQPPIVPNGPTTVTVARFTDGLPVDTTGFNPGGPTDMQSIPNGTHRIAVTHYGGQVITVDSTGAHAAVPFVDLTDSTSPTYNPNFEVGDASGLTSIAFHPGFADSTSAGYAKFYLLESEAAGSGAGGLRAPDFGDLTFPSVVNTTNGNHEGVLYEYTLPSPMAESCSTGCTKREVMRVAQPGWHHNLGDLAFDSNALLYISSGDGSTSFQTAPYMSDNSQLLTNVYGKVLRIDPLGTNSDNGAYGVPATNPVADGTGGNVDEIFAFGLRNPYRLAMDSVTGDLYASETGELSVESVDRIVAGGNYGWNYKEGSFLYDPSDRSISDDVDLDGNGVSDFQENHVPPLSLIDPVFEYGRVDGRSIIGGVLYRGSLLPQLEGMYVFADLTGDLFYGDPSTGEEYRLLIDPAGDDLLPRIFSVNEDENGELYVLGLPTGATEGVIVRLVPEPSSVLLLGVACWMGTGTRSLRRSIP